MFNEFRERVDQRQEGHRRQEEEEEEASRARYEQERRQRQYQEQRRQEEEQQQQKKEQARHEQEKEQQERRYHEEQQQQQQRANSRQNSYKDPYEVLGVARDMTLEEIRSVFKQLCKIYHPDVGQIPNDAKMKDINLAYDEIKKMHK